MAHSLVNPPCRVIFAGWESDTYSLGRAGWEISIQRSPRPEYYGAIDTMLLHHPSSKLMLMAECREFFTLDWRRNGEMDRDLPVFYVRRAGTDLIIRHEIGILVEHGFSAWADHEPKFIDTSIRNTPLFLNKAAPAAEQLIVEPATVAELLEQIRKQQAPLQAEIRERDRRRAREAAPVLHAQILTFPRAA